MQVTPVQTLYKSVLFRSRLEARWAVFFDALVIEWEYEPEGFNLPNGSRYLPDFRLWRRKGEHWGWVEVKPREESGLSKPKAFAQAAQVPVLVLVGPPCFGVAHRVLTPEIDNWASFEPASSKYHPTSLWGSAQEAARASLLNKDILAPAVQKALSARFETR